jgi:23S rRNA (adenine2503-C2)-methyltransferase
VRRLVEPRGCGLAARHLTISTVGFVPGILRLAREPYHVRLAVSLHAPNDDIRGQLVPVNRRYPVADLLAACREYQRATGERITFEYTLIAGVNDSPTVARELVRRVRGLDCHINLIPLNPVDELPWQPPTPEVVDSFHDLLRDAGVVCTVRREMGRDIKAACGQLKTEVARRRARVNESQ